MRYALLVFVAVVSSAAGHSYAAFPPSVGYVVPASLTSAYASRAGREEAASDATSMAIIQELPLTTTTASAASLEPVGVVEGASVGENSAIITTQATPSIKPLQTTSDSSAATAQPPNGAMITSAASTANPLPAKDEITTANTAEVLTELPISMPPVLSSPDNDPDSSKRRIINYDQRQEGQYNIRADLENFMIVLIPPTPSEGLSLLDLITKSALRRSPQRSKSKRKQYASSAATKYHHPLKSASLQYVARQSTPTVFDDSRAYLTPPSFSQSPFDTFIGSHSSQASLGASSNRISDFLEGRTSPRFQITSNEESTSTRFQPDRQVDVLPPPYPLAYQHLIKPYHLEVEPTVIQALPPSELNAAAPAHISGNYLDSYNQILSTGLNGGNSATAGDVATISTTTATAAVMPNDSGTGYYRLSRAIRGDSYFDSNRVSSPNSLRHANLDLQPVYRAEHSLGAAYLYPPIDAPHLYFTPESNAKNVDRQQDAVDRAQDLDDTDDDARVGELYVPPFELKDDIEWENFFDTMTKEANGASCGPGQRRDSYGACRKIQGY